MVDLKSMAIDNSKIYALVRVSSDKQDFSSQWNSIQSFTKQNNIELLKENIIEEFNVSGYKTPYKERKGLQKALELAKANKLQLLIVFNMDRLRQENRNSTIY